MHFGNLTTGGHNPVNKPRLRRAPLLRMPRIRFHRKRNFPPLEPRPKFFIKMVAVGCFLQNRPISLLRSAHGPPATQLIGWRIDEYSVWPAKKAKPMSALGHS